MRKLISLLLLLISLPVVAKDWPARLEWSRRVSLSLPVSGIVTQVKANVGDHVQAGQILLQLDEEGFKARVDSAQAKLTQAKHTLTEARREWKRAKALYERTVLSDTDLQNAKLALIRAKSQFDISQASLRKEKLDLKYSVLRAPFEGIVVQREVEVGQTIVSRLQANPLMVLVEWGRILASLSVTEESLKDFKEGAKATVIINNKRFSGTVKSVGMEPIDGKEIYKVDIQFDTQGQVLRAGQKGLVKFNE